jgi:hypothetical protein
MLRQERSLFSGLTIRFLGLAVEAMVGGEKVTRKVAVYGMAPAAQGVAPASRWIGWT